MESAKKNGKEEEHAKKTIMEANPSDDIPVPDNLLVKFLQCECGALLDATDTNVGLVIMISRKWRKISQSR
jgi:hypothetical protein